MTSENKKTYWVNVEDENGFSTYLAESDDLSKLYNLKLAWEALRPYDRVVLEDPETFFEVNWKDVGYDKA